MEVAKDHIKKLLELKNASDLVRKDIDNVFVQISIIGTIRNDLLHYGPQGDENGALVATNRMVAFKPDRIRERLISPDILDALTDDLDKISKHLVYWLTDGWVPDETREQVAGTAMRRAWRYKPQLQPRLKT